MRPAPETTPRAGPASTALLHLGLVGLWLLAFLAARLLEYAPHASLWFPPSAVTFAALLVLGLRALPALWLACAGATWLTELAYGQSLGAGRLLASSLVFAAGHTLAFGLVAVLLRRLARRRSRHDATLAAMTAFLLLGAVGAGLAALFGAYGLSLTGMIAPDEVAGILAPWWIGDYAGLLALGPLLVSVLILAAERLGVAVEAGLPRLAPRGEREGSSGVFLAKLALLLGLGLAILLAYAAWPGHPPLLFTLFLAVVVQLWIVYTESPDRALVGVASFSLLLAAACAVLGLQDAALILQFALIALAANSYFGLAVPALYADNRRLRHLLTHDSLTGVYSRAFFEDRARDGIEAAVRRLAPAALVMIDLDRLKAINDEQGHAAGDAALRQLADCCASALRPGDVIGRLSGDEFGVFLPASDAAEAGAVLARMRQALDERGRGLQASFGLAVAGVDGSDYESLLARADAAMYRDKRSSP
jgi:diguanylate cyclase (GGDEF)-like protein